MTYGQYITNASTLNININNAHDSLITEWGKGSISYPRTNGVNHPPLTVKNFSKINKEVLHLLNFNIEKVKKSYKKVNKDTIYYIVEQLQLSSPSSLINDIAKAKKIKKRKFDDEYLEKKITYFLNISKKDKYENINKVSLKDLKKIKTLKLNKKLTKIFDKIR